MIKKIINLVKQLSDSEKKILYNDIKNNYCLEEKTGMLRDDIKFKITELIEVNCTWLKEVQEDDDLQELELDEVDITAFADTLLIEFGLEQIEFSEIMKWQTVKDIVNYIEEALENKMSKHAKREQKKKEIRAYARKASKTFSEKQREPYISAFEIEV